MTTSNLVRALALTLLVSAASARAQEAGRDGVSAPLRDTSQLRLGTFEVGDLVVTVPDYVAPSSENRAADGGYDARGGGFGGGGGGYGGGGYGGMGGRGMDPASGMPMASFDA